MKVIRVSNNVTDRSVGTIKQYLTDIARYNVLTNSEEEMYTLKAANGDKSAKDELVRRNLRFVITVAKQYEMNGVELDDLINEGNIGLVMAAENYNPTTGFKFITYAVFWIKKLILEYLAKNGKLIRLPANKLAIINKLNQKASEMEQKMGRNVDISEILHDSSEITDGEDLSEFNRLSMLSFESLDSPLDSDETASRHDIMADESFKPTDYELTHNDLKKQISNGLKILKPRDRQIMVFLFGLDGSTPLTLEAVSEKFDLTREMIRQIKQKSLVKLKDVLVPF
jgi:RNA polymerase primary sigma factor